MRTRLIAVVGNGGRLSEEQERLAEEVGAAIVGAGFGLLCGGLGGVMKAAARGAARARGKASAPPIVGLLPSYDHAAGNPHLDLALPTGLGHARNALVASCGDAVICVGGAMGALSEVALARKIGRPVVSIAKSGGTADLVARAVPTVLKAATAREAVARIKEVLS